MTMPDDKKQEWKKLGLNPEYCTCLNCEDECFWRWDIYNFDGDCLREK